MPNEKRCKMYWYHSISTGRQWIRYTPSSLYITFLIVSKLFKKKFKNLSLSLSISIYIKGTYDKFPDFFRMGTFIDSTDMKL